MASSYIDEVYGGGSGGGGSLSFAPPPPPAPQQQPLAPAPLQQQSAISESPSFVSTILKKGVVWVIFAVLAGVSLAATIIGLRWRSITGRLARDELDQDEANVLKQKTVVTAVAAAIAVAAITLLVTRLVLKWTF
jgi:hypothetical protein